MSGPFFSMIVNGPFSSDTWSPTLKLESSESFTTMSRCVCFDLVTIEGDEVAGALRLILLIDMSSQRTKRLHGLFGAKLGWGFLCRLIEETDGICL